MSSSPNPKRLLLHVISIAVVLTVIFNVGVASAAQKFNEDAASDECPASLVTLGEDLWDQIPEFPSLNWDFELPVKATLLWNAFLVLIDSIFPGFSRLLPNMNDLARVLSWLPASWFEDDSLTPVPVISQVSGSVIGLVPVVGPILDGTAILTAKDHITGECISRMGQGVLLASAGATLVFPALLAVKGGLKVGKPLAKMLQDIPISRVSKKLTDLVEESRARFGLKVSRLIEVNEVVEAYRGMLRIVGKGAVSSSEFAKELHLSSFTENNYREGLLRLTGRTSEEVQGLQAHHILPREFEESFLNAGVESIHDPRLLVWVEEGPHQRWSHDYSEAWRDFFSTEQNNSVEDVLEEARRLAKEYDYPVSFEMPIIRLPGWVRLPFLND